MKALILCLAVAGLATAEFAAYHALKANAIMSDSSPSVATAASYYFLPIAIMALAIAVPFRKHLQ